MANVLWKRAIYNHIVNILNIETLKIEIPNTHIKLSTSQRKTECGRIRRI